LVSDRGAYDNVRAPVRSRHPSRGAKAMSDSSPRRPSAGPERGEPPSEPIPLFQRLLDSPFLLLVACLVIMCVFFTGWGVYEMFSLDQAPLP